LLGYAGGLAGLVLVAAVEHVGCVVRTVLVCPSTKPEKLGVIDGTVPP
jgi:hypothetical protein